MADRRQVEQSIDSCVLDDVQGIRRSGAEFQALRVFEWNYLRQGNIDICRAGAGDGIARSRTEGLAGRKICGECGCIEPVVEVASTRANGDSPERGWAEPSRECAFNLPRLKS